MNFDNYFFLKIFGHDKYELFSLKNLLKQI